MTVRSLLREPLVHFLLIGLLLFAIFGVAGGSGSTAVDDVIDVDAATIELLSRQWQQVWNRPPTEAELRGLVQNHIREEVLFREAVKMGLDENDTIIRRRLVQKMEFLIADAALPQEPSDEELQEYFAEHRERYRVPERSSFTHVYLSEDRRGESALTDAEALLDELRRRSVERAPDAGDRFMLHSDYVLKSASEIDQTFGNGFGQAILEAPVGEWYGPVRSGYGLHLVRVTQRKESRDPELEEVRRRVAADFLDARRRRANEEALEALRENYEIRVSGLES